MTAWDGPPGLQWWHTTFDLPSRTEIRHWLASMKREIMATLADVQAQIQQANDATNDIASDVERLKSDLDAALASAQGQVDAAVAEQLQAVSDGLSPLVSRLQDVASGTENPTTPGSGGGTPEEPPPTDGGTDPNQPEVTPFRT